MSGVNTINHQKVIHQTTNYLLHTKNRGLHLRPLMNIINPRTQKFTIKGRADSNCGTNEETRKMVRGLEVTLNGTPVIMRSVGQKMAALSVTEAELIDIAQVVQEMLYVMRIFESMQLLVKKPMIVKSDSKDTIPYP